MELYKYSFDKDSIKLEVLGVKKNTLKRYELDGYYSGNSLGYYFYKKNLDKAITDIYSIEKVYCILLEKDEFKAKKIIMDKLELDLNNDIAEIREKLEYRKELLKVVERIKRENNGK